MELDEPRPLVQIESADNKNYSIQLVPNLGQDILATGRRYTEDMLKMSAADMLGVNTSGVLSKIRIFITFILNQYFILKFENFHLFPSLKKKVRKISKAKLKCDFLFTVLGVNSGIKFSNYLRNGAPIQTFEVTGKFGKATETNFQGSHVTNRGSYKHVTKGKLQALISSLQTSFQKQMYDMCGLDIQSQEAYELACKGLIRPVNTKNTVIYGIRNTEFTGRTFTIEVQAMNASEDFLSSLILDIAVQLRTVAHCTKMRCTRYGYFSFEQSLLRSHWNLQNVLSSMHECQQIWKAHPDMVSEEITSPVGYMEDLQKS